MIKQLRRKIVLVITVIVAFLVAGMVISINVLNRTGTQNDIINQLNVISDRDGRPAPREMNPFHDMDEGYVDYFSVMIDFDGKIIGFSINRNVLVEQDEILPYVDQALNEGNEYGYIGSYAYTVKEKNYGYIIVFTDVSAKLESMNSLIITTGIIGAAAILVFFFIALLLSKWLVRPVKETFEKQKLFISNASHELKTPLAVISANADVLQSEIGDNKWLGYIRSESSRMSELVNELLSLARLEDKAGHKLQPVELNLSDLILRTALPFESTAFELGKTIETDVPPGIMCRCDESTVKHLVTILIDNAVKYSDEHGTIRVSLMEHSGKKRIEVFNTGEGIRPDKLEKVFERFYREDEVRNSKSGGYGLGLSIARAAAEAHGGRIYAESEYGSWAKFVVIL